MPLIRAIALLLVCLIPPALSAQTDSYDLVIRNGRIIDGTGSPWYAGGHGHPERPDRRDRPPGQRGHATDHRRRRPWSSRPGFIDMLGQSELTILVAPSVPSKIFQGITTEITGEGGSAGPLNDSIIAADRPGYDHYKVTPDWRTLGEYFARLEKQGIGINFASYVGATQVRRMVLGDGDRPPTPDELDRMKALVRDAMHEGAVGVSTSLQYPPAPYAQTEELSRWRPRPRRSAASTRRTCARKASRSTPRSTRRSGSAARRGSRSRSGISRWPASGTGAACRGWSPRSTRPARAGVDIAADTYAYPAWFNSMSAFVPPWAHDGGNAKLVERLQDPAARRRIRRDMLDPKRHLGQRVAGDSRAVMRS